MKKFLAHPSIRRRRFAFDSPDCLVTEDPDGRMARFTRWAVELSARASLEALGRAGLAAREVSALVVNTCTGYLCPGLSSYLLERLGLPRDIRAYDLVGGGCGGAIPNLQAGEECLKAAGAGVALCVAVEICSATFQMEDDLSLILSNALFSAGEWIVKALGGKGNVVELMGLQTSTPGQDRHSGFLEGIAGSDLQVIFRADMQWLEPNARQEMESALARFDKIDCVFAHNDDGAHGAYLAAKAAGREKQMKFVGIDALPQEGVAYVRQGILDATFQYPTGGAEAIDTALKILHGETVPKDIVLGTRLFDKDNVAQGGVALQ